MNKKLIGLTFINCIFLLMLSANAAHSFEFAEQTYKPVKLAPSPSRDYSKFYDNSDSRKYATQFQQNADMVPTRDSRGVQNGWIQKNPVAGGYTTYPFNKMYEHGRSD